MELHLNGNQTSACANSQDLRYYISVFQAINTLHDEDSEVPKNMHDGSLSAEFYPSRILAVRKFSRKEEAYSKTTYNNLPKDMALAKAKYLSKKKICKTRTNSAQDLSLYEKKSPRLVDVVKISKRQKTCTTCLCIVF
ncbi:hypothetical protein SteCoe_20419 [Stentor coeruleus]|uniref:Uncharacterized protein n=1 Tax=Stentor coeruleus TaxID=5963 RepID=A0A1R2BS89_9CILI|nr:hypothetical protein SteCoe_20419 [Stentor coeruleus]